MSPSSSSAIPGGDPAVGSGHFLVGAAHRLARHLARVRANAQGESEPSPLLYQHALRDVIGRCLYGVDINPMSAELCRVGLWLEALEPGKPLSFLDHHIQVGNSLLGTTPALLAKGIPDEAFTPIEGDLKAKCTELRRDNKRERTEFKSGQGYLFEPALKLGNLAAELAKIDETPDDSAEGVLEKERRYAELVKGQAYQSGRLLADTWCAAFVWKKDDSELGNLCPTERTFRKVESHAASGLLPHVLSEVERLRDKYLFFHWHLAFPEVFRQPVRTETPDNEQAGWNGGFSVVLGNPPWVRQESLANVKKLLATSPSFSSTADLSVFFTELASRITSTGGRAGLLTPNKWLRNKYGSNLRAFLEQTCQVHLLIDFGHSRDLFPGIDTFPAICVLQPVQNRHPTSSFRYLATDDDQRKAIPLATLLSTKAISLSSASLRGEQWDLDDPAVTQLERKLSQCGQPLQTILQSPIRRGVNTGFNEAFLIDLETKNRLESIQPACADLIHPWAGGSEVNRWFYSPSNEFLIFTRRGTNIDAFPAIEQHLTKFRDHLTPKLTASQKGHGRKPGPYKWFEIQDNTAYYREFERPKILVPTILYYSDFAYVAETVYPSSKVNVIPTSDLAILAVLNSSVMWWLMHHKFVGMKDDAISAEVNGLNSLPIPAMGAIERRSLENYVSQLIAKGIKADSSTVLNLELAIDAIVCELFGLTDEDREIISRSEPPRDPIAIAKRRSAAEHHK